MNVISRHVLSSKIVSDELLFEVWQAGEFIRQLVDNVTKFIPRLKLRAFLEVNQYKHYTKKDKSLINDLSVIQIITFFRTNH